MQGGGARCVVSGQRPLPGCTELLGGRVGERPGVIVRGLELGAESVGLFQVVAKQFLLLSAFPGLLLQPAGEALVQPARFSQRRLVGGVTDQVVAELQGILAGGFRMLQVEQGAAPARLVAWNRALPAR